MKNHLLTYMSAVTYYAWPKKHSEASTLKMYESPNHSVEADQGNARYPSQRWRQVCTPHFVYTEIQLFVAVYLAILIHIKAK